MIKEILTLAEYFEKDKGISKERIFSIVESSLEVAVPKALKLGRGQQIEDISVQIDRRTGILTITVDGEPMDVKEINRIGSQMTRNILLQKLQEEEARVYYDKYKNKKGEIVGAVVQRVMRYDVFLTVGEVEAVMSRSDQVSRDDYRVQDRIRVYVNDIERKEGGIIMRVSRSNPKLVEKLFEFEIPEVSDGVIQIKSIARQPGERTKIAVFSHSPSVDCVGTCVGVCGSRIKSISKELNGEKIDIIPWDESPEQFVKNALEPAQASRVEFFPDSRVCRVEIPEDKLSLAIGKKGQNARLASRLTGWDIDIQLETKEEKSNIEDIFRVAISEEESEVDGSVVEGEDLSANQVWDRSEAVEYLKSNLDISEDVANRLIIGGFASMELISESLPSDLVETVFINAEVSEKIVERARAVLKNEENKEEGQDRLV